MLQNLPMQPADKILQLMQMFREDTRTDKIDLGVGVYKNADGVTPIMGAVKAAEERIWQSETTKAYTGLAGTPEFNSAMIDLILDGAVPADSVASVATPGGTGALRIAFELVRLANPGVRFWYSNPTWANHAAMLKYLSLPAKAYRYFNDGGVDVNGMLEDLKGAAPGDVVLLHGCCHNPTGANLRAEDWDAVIDLINAEGLIPLIDVAYQGFGDGLEADAANLRKVAKACPETLIAASCSKNFGVYKERTGILLAVDHNAAQRAVTQSNLSTLNRMNYSFPPDHGARIVSTVLSDAELRADWQSELEAVRSGMLDLRKDLSSALRQETNSDRFDFLANHRGMFSMLGITPDEVVRLRETHAIYVIGDSRMNVAGLNKSTVPVLARAIADVIG
ncbi:MAG: amino acid aminotransferase [Pseudomonadota bacterium]